MAIDWRFDVLEAANRSESSTLRIWPHPIAGDLSMMHGFVNNYRSIERSTNVAKTSSLITELSRQAAFSDLFNALSELSTLDEDDPAVIDDDTFDKATTVLSLLASRSALPPKIFSHGGDAAVFSWTDASGLKYITVSGGCAVFARRDRGEKPVTIGVADMTETNSVELLPTFGVIRDSSSTNSIR